MNYSASFWLFGLINVEDVDHRPSRPLRKRRTALTAAIISVIILALIIGAIMQSSSHPSIEAVLKASDINTAQITIPADWEQGLSETKPCNPNTPEMGYIVVTTSTMYFTNSTVNVTLVVQVIEFSSLENARYYYENQVQTAYSTSNITVTNLSDGKGIIMALPNPYDGESDIFQSSIFYNGGSMVGSIYLPGSGLQRDDYSLITAIVELQVQRI